MEVAFPSRYLTMPDSEYRSVEAVSQSHLKRILLSPLHFYNEVVNPREMTDAQRLGLAVHHDLLGCHEKCHMIVRPEDMSPYTKEGKAWKADQLSKGNIIVEAEEILRIANMRKSLEEDPDVNICLRGDAEVSCFAEMEVCGESVLCKGRLDLLPKKSDTIVDVKTCHSGSLHSINNDIAKFFYAFQAVHYLKLFNASRFPGELERDKFLFVFIESEPPHGIRKIMLSERWLQLAEEQWLQAMTKLVECRRTGEWPGYDRQIVILNPPSRDEWRHVEAVL
ncbi:MAG TPA: PD-(D/E)XK nuclease-like domain-containing protein [Nitrospiraceae bacterium]|nr:PD-(D/E)XK nuclease-like domain-containing protein [Nitrospiraceae bacterium]